MTGIKVTRPNARAMALYCESDGKKWRWISVCLPVYIGVNQGGLDHAGEVLETAGNLIKYGIYERRFVRIGGGIGTQTWEHTEWMMHQGWEPEAKE